MSLINGSVQANSLQGIVINPKVYWVLHTKRINAYVILNETPLKSLSGSQSWGGGTLLQQNFTRQN